MSEGADEAGSTSAPHCVANMRAFLRGQPYGTLRKIYGIFTEPIRNPYEERFGVGTSSVILYTVRRLLRLAVWSGNKVMQSTFEHSCGHRFYKRYKYNDSEDSSRVYSPIAASFLPMYDTRESGASRATTDTRETFLFLRLVPQTLDSASVYRFHFRLIPRRRMYPDGCIRT